MFSTSDLKCLSDDSLETILAIFQNIIDNPDDPKFLKVSKASKKYQSTLCDKTGRLIPMVLVIFRNAGFEDGVDTFTCFEKNEEAIRQLLASIKSAQEARDAEKQKKKPKSAFDFELRRDLAAEARKSQEQLQQIREEQTKRFSSLPAPKPSSKPSDGGGCLIT